MERGRWDEIGPRIVGVSGVSSAAEDGARTVGASPRLARQWPGPPRPRHGLMWTGRCTVVRGHGLMVGGRSRAGGTSPPGTEPNGMSEVPASVAGMSVLPPAPFGRL